MRRARCCCVPLTRQQLQSPTQVAVLPASFASPLSIKDSEISQPLTRQQLQPRRVERRQRDRLHRAEGTVQRGACTIVCVCGGGCTCVCNPCTVRKALYSPVPGHCLSVVTEFKHDFDGCAGQRSPLQTHTVNTLTRQQAEAGESQVGALPDGGADRDAQRGAKQRRENVLARVLGRDVWVLCVAHVLFWLACKGLSELRASRMYGVPTATRKQTPYKCTHLRCWCRAQMTV